MVETSLAWILPFCKLQNEDGLLTRRQQLRSRSNEAYVGKRCGMEMKRWEVLKRPFDWNIER